MTHVTELAIGAALIGALGIGAVVMTPTRKPSGQTTITIEPMPGHSRRAEPSPPKTDAERITALHRRIAAIKAEQRELARTVRALAPERSER